MCSHSQKICHLLVQYLYVSEKHSYGQQNNPAAEKTVGSLAVAMRMQVSVPLFVDCTNVADLLLFL